MAESALTGVTGRALGGGRGNEACCHPEYGMHRLSDTQSILLAHAAQRTSGSIYPLPSSLRRGGGTATAVTALIRASYAEEGETDDDAAILRSEDGRDYGLFITPAGLAAIGITDEASAEAANFTSVIIPAAAPASALRSTKAAIVMAMLARDGGATLPELVSATSWLPHTIRAAMTGLRKKGHVVARSTRDGATCYRIEVAA